MRSNSFVQAASAAAVLFAGAGIANADPINIWDFNVFSRSTIGTAGSGYGSDFQGSAGSVGSAWFSGFSLKDVPSASPSLARAYYGGGNFTLSGAVTNHGIEVAGNVVMNHASINGPVFAGGNLSGLGGSLNGPVSLGGIKTVGPAVTVLGTLSENAPYTPTINVFDVSDQFLSISNYAASLAPSATATNLWGELQITASGPLTVVDIAAADLASAWGIKISGAGTVVINLLGETVSFGSKTWTYADGASGSSTLLNLNEATTFNLSGGDHKVSILAPNAATHFSSGLVTGNLIVGSLTGGGQVNWNPSGGFNGEIPAPGTAVLALAGMGLMATRRRR
ncbi:MAG: choice-of-anchor A family protein [Phycisphaeraceae bacterium]|nr:MAG: choice-of-anchor A family protein [Phycisphaeraceae bacterium]